MHVLVDETLERLSFVWQQVLSGKSLYAMTFNFINGGLKRTERDIHESPLIKPDRSMSIIVNNMFYFLHTVPLNRYAILIINLTYLLFFAYNIN